MKIYVFIFVLSCCIFEHAHSSNWKEIILIHQQIREIKSIIDNVLIQLKIMIIRKGSVEAIGCYKEAKSKLSGIKQIGYVNVTNCFRNSKDDISAGIICAVKVQQSVREASQTVSVEAIKCINDLSIGDPLVPLLKNYPFNDYSEAKSSGLPQNFLKQFP